MVERATAMSRLRRAAVTDTRTARGRGVALATMKHDQPVRFTDGEIAELAQAFVDELDEIDAEFAAEQGDRQDQVRSYTQRTHDRVVHLIRCVMQEACMATLLARADAEDLAERLAAVERRLADQQGGGATYRSVWHEGGQYKRGAFVTVDGSMWHANQDTAERPGRSDAWTLAVKRGRDGKDLRA